MVSSLYLWLGVQGNQLEVEEVAALVTRAELVGALQTVLALEQAVGQTAEHAVNKRFMEEMLGWLEYNILQALKEISSGMWPFSGAYDVFKYDEKAEKVPTPQPQKAEARG